jgi:hypothetical protein
MKLNVTNIIKKVSKLQNKQIKKSNIKWSKIQPVNRGRKIIDTKVSSTKDHISRFVLYQTSKRIPTLWDLWDQKTGIVWFLYGEGWKGAEISASKRVTEILEGKYDRSNPKKQHMPSKKIIKKVK